MSLSRSRLAAALLIGLLSTSVLPAATVAAATSFTGLSAVGSGLTGVWRSPDRIFSAPVDQDETPVVSAIALYSQSGDPWSAITIGAPIGEPLAVGTYTNATSTHGDAPWLYLNATGCASETGEFEVLELETSGDTVTRLAFRFEFSCNGTDVTRAADYRYNSTIDLPAPLLAPRFSDAEAVHDFGSVLGGTSSDPVTVTLTNDGTAPLTVTDVALTGHAPSSFEITDDSCSGVTLAPSTSCPVAVRARPPVTGGSHEADLTFTTDATRGPFSEILRVTGETPTSIEITTPANVTGLRNIPLTAHINPSNATTRAGTVVFYRDDVSLGTVGFDVNGDASMTLQFAIGEHVVRAVYAPPCCFDPVPAPTETTKAITALAPVDISFVGGSPDSVPEGTSVTYQVQMETTSPPASGTLRVRNATTDTILASREVTSASTSLTTPEVILPVGTWQIVAEFIGDPTYAQTTTSRIQMVTMDTTVGVVSVGASPTTFYPSADGYRDTVKISGTTLEPATVTVRIYNSKGKSVRTLTVGSKNGPYSITWNGRTSSGTAVPAGTYKIRQTLVDARHNTLTKDTAVKVSWRKVRWVKTSGTKNGESYAWSSKAGKGSVSKGASSYAHGVKLAGGSSDGFAVARWKFTLHSGLAYKGLKLEVLGKGTQSSSRGILAFAEDAVGALVGARYAWWHRSGPVSGHVHTRVVLLDLETDGPMSGAFDVAKTRVSYSYAVWR